MNRIVLGLLVVAISISNAFGETWTDPETGICWTYQLEEPNAACLGDGGASCIDPEIAGSLSIPASVDGYPVKTIASHAFANCQLLESLHLPASVTEIHPGVFSHCDALVQLTVDSANPTYHVQDGILYRYGQGGETLISGVAVTAGDVVVPSTVVAIAEGAFLGNGRIVSVVIPGSVKTIGQNAFWACHNLQSVILKPGIRDIGGAAFDSCNKLVSIVIPAGVESIGSSAFFDELSRENTILFLGSVLPAVDPLTFGIMKATTVYVPRESEMTWNTEMLQMNGVQIRRYENDPVCVVLDPSGGALPDGNARNFRPGDVYGDLPVPVRENAEFLGWYTGKRDGHRVSSDEYVDWTVVRLYARWDCDIVTALSEGAVSAKTSGDCVFAENGDITFVPDFEPVFGLVTNCWLEAVVEGEGVVSFDWTVEAELSSWATAASCELLFTVDGSVKNPATTCGRVTLQGGRSSMGWILAETVSSTHHVRIFLTPGRHTLRWEIPYAYSMFLQNVSLRGLLSNFKVERSGVKDSLADWFALLSEFRIWQPDTLAHLHDDIYGARIASNPNDYEARILRAATHLLQLQENAEVREFIADCGFTIADYSMKKSGQFAGFEHLAPSDDIVDRFAPVALAAIDEALADVTAIPENWAGFIELNPKTYTFLNEPVHVDLAEVTALRAALEAARASVLLVKGYDFAMDYVAVSNAVETADGTWGILDAAPQAGAIRDAAALIESKEWYRKSLKHVRRSDQIIQWRTSSQLHFFEYDSVDADKLARARLYLDQLIGSLDHPESIDLPYFVDKFGYEGETLPGGMFRQVYLGAIFAGRMTRDLVPDVWLQDAALDMDTVGDTTVGGLLPDFGFEEFATLYPLSQRWSLALYDVCCPASRLLQKKTLTISDESVCDGTLSYVADVGNCPGSVATCRVDGYPVEVIDDGNRETGNVRSVAVPAGRAYELVFESGSGSMRSRQRLFEILSVPDSAPVGDGTYAEEIDGVVWSFTVEGDVVTVTGASPVNADVLIPSRLGGRDVVAIGEGVFSKSGAVTVTVPASVTSIGVEAFFKCQSLSEIRFLGDEPEVGEDAFYKVSATAVFNGGTKLSNLEGRNWNGLDVQYAADGSNEQLRVRANLPDGYEFTDLATLTLSVDSGATIYFTMNGAEPTTKSLVYTTPISVSVTTRIKYFAVDPMTGDSGPVGSLVLRLAAPDEEQPSELTRTKSVNGIVWSYQEADGAVRLTGCGGAGCLPVGRVELPSAVNWQPVTAVGASCFASCDQVTSVVLPSTVTTIDREAFRGCTRLESVTLPEGLGSIGDCAFERCTSLTNVVIPASVTNIGYFAFRDCLRLASVELKGTAPRQDLGVYMGVPAFTTLSGRLGAATAIVYTVITNDSPEITVPETWLEEIAVLHDKPAGADSYQAAFEAKFGADLKAALTKPTGKRDLKGNALCVWQDYVAGTDPLNEEDKFTATLTMEDGVPTVRWSPELTPEMAARRKYVVYGATALDGQWVDVSSKTDAERQALGYQFFRVSVEMRP